ncbi:polyprenyl synthetase family protein [Candidatus Bipolaricaulota bacterium]|nr:polyprenyl synthetase family protein [Candidatus Bipolaricaulota bacterium]
MTPNAPLLLSRHAGTLEAALRSALHGDSLLHPVLRYHVGLEDEHGKAVNRLGKLLRPSLVLFTCEQLQGPLDRAIRAAVALELVHNFSLIHDDIQDKDPTRRGCPTVWSRIGVEQAINAGDLLHTIALREIIACGEEATEALNRATMSMIEGQAMDLSFEDRHADADEYLTMIDRKTGALLCCAFELGAVCAGASAEVCGALVEFGHFLGRAFQIRDDILGIWGDPTITGKPRGSDIRRRKKSFPIAHAFEHAAAEDRKVLSRVYAADSIDDQRVSIVMDVLQRTETESLSEAQVRSDLLRAREILESLPFEPSGLHAMQGLVAFLARRDK